MASAPKYRGMNKVNPLAMILSGMMMLKYMEKRKGGKLEIAIKEVIKEGKKVTYDLKPTPADPTACGTREVGEAIIEKLRSFS